MSTDRLRLELEDALEAVRPLSDGAVSSYLEDVSPGDLDVLGAAVCDTYGRVTVAGDGEATFALQSVSKAFTFAVALQERGLDEVLAKVGLEPTGDAFNEASLLADGRPFNPLINAGGILTHGLLPGGNEFARMDLLLDRLSALAGERVEVDEAVFAAEEARGHRNLALAHLLKSSRVLDGDPHEVVRGYLRACSVLVDVRQLAVMGATLASGGVQPVTGERVLDEDVVTLTLSTMLTCGMYDASGEWVADVGLPAKSGVSGALLGVVPGVVGLASISRRLDPVGSSVRGVALFEELSRRWDLHLLRHRAPLAGLRKAMGEHVED